MPLDTVKLLNGAEIEAQKRKDDALAAGRKAIAQAREEGEARLAKAKEDAEKEAAEFLRRHEAEKKLEGNDAHLQSRRACNAMRAEAMGKLDEAAQTIAERIVGS